MKIIEERIFHNSGNVYDHVIFSQALSEIHNGIKKVTWPELSSEFTINPTPKGNGVKPIKNQFVKYLISMGWLGEQSSSIVNGMSAGPIDIIKKTTIGTIAVEWETGNISSSHRALNKLATGIIQDHIIGGILILPVRNLARYLTDRIGNFEEISPYFMMYQSMKLEKGLLGVISVDYDNVSKDVPLILKGKDGNAKKS